MTHRQTKSSKATPSVKRNPLPPNNAPSGWRFIIFLAAVALMTFFGAYTFIVSRLDKQPSAKTAVHALSEVVTTDGLYSITVKKAVLDNTIGLKLHLPDTKRVLVVDAEIKNLSTKDLNFLPAIHTFVRDDQANTYDFSPGLTKDTIPAELIKPGETLRGQLAFIVPSSYVPLWFYLDARFGDQGPVSFQVVP